jgi:hypothetical protein
MSSEKPRKIVDLRVRVPASLDREIEQLSGRARSLSARGGGCHQGQRGQWDAAMTQRKRFPSHIPFALGEELFVRAENAKREAAFGGVD